VGLELKADAVHADHLVMIIFSCLCSTLSAGT